MTDAIWNQRFLSRDVPAWHNLGRVFTEVMTASQACQEVGADYLVYEYPVYSLVPDTANPSNLVQLFNPKYKQIVRGPTKDEPYYHPLGIVGKDFVSIPNKTICEIVDPLTQQWPVETFGILERGRTLFLTLKAESALVGGEEIDCYYLVTDGKAGNGKLTIAFTPVRVVCQNTLICGLESASVTHEIRHRPSVEDRFRFRIDMTRELIEARKAVLAAMQHLAETRIDESELDIILKAAYKSLSKTADVKDLEYVRQHNLLISDKVMKGLESSVATFDSFASSREKARDAARNHYVQICDEYPKIAGTAWAAWQAITGVEDSRPTNRANDYKGVAMQSVFGSRVKIKTDGFASALKIARSKGK